MPLKDWIQVDSEIWKKEEELNLSVDLDLRRNKKLFQRSQPAYVSRLRRSMQPTSLRIEAPSLGATNQPM